MCSNGLTVCLVFTIVASGIGGGGGAHYGMVGVSPDYYFPSKGLFAMIRLIAIAISYFYF